MQYIDILTVLSDLLTKDNHFQLSAYIQYSKMKLEIKNCFSDKMMKISALACKDNTFFSCLILSIFLIFYTFIFKVYSCYCYKMFLFYCDHRPNLSHFILKTKRSRFTCTFQHICVLFQNYTIVKLHSIR